ncbi:MAG TPA: hypothetical protein VKE96_00085 [Vicinamibacterales bacterium]|nr:hypothetical protein [Vicinamibacterales bacterium]
MRMTSKQYEQFTRRPTPRFLVQHFDGAWIDCVREDLYDGENEAVLMQPAEFDSPEQAEVFIDEVCGLMHCGGDRDHFRIVAVSR